MADEPRTQGEHGLDYLSTENNEGELVIALRNIRRAMEERGWGYERAVERYGIRGHPRFAEFWPVTKYWGDARFAREQMGLPLDE